MTPRLALRAAVLATWIAVADVVADPLEQDDLAAEHPEVFESLRGRYLEFARHLAERSRAGARSGEAPEIDPELRRRLEALGYTGD